MSDFTRHIFKQLHWIYRVRNLFPDVCIILKKRNLIKVRSYKLRNTSFSAFHCFKVTRSVFNPTSNVLGHFLSSVLSSDIFFNKCNAANQLINSKFGYLYFASVFTFFSMSYTLQVTQRCVICPSEADLLLITIPSSLSSKSTLSQNVFGTQCQL